MGQWVGGPGPAKCDQNFQNMPSLWRHLQKTRTENEKLFFMSTRRLTESVEGMNSSLALAAGDLWPKKGRPIAVVKGLMNQIRSNKFVSKHSVQNNSIVAFMNTNCWYISVEFRPYDTLATLSYWPIYIGMSMRWSSSNLDCHQYQKR